ncbi:uncharacterized protein [Epargyreus clarus]|uniref:uncharacterized protein n=1 Tax=Epargyreus clarus TaxID=520877 RepID=UPI003C2E10F6
MTKATANKANGDLSEFCRSAFNLTFAIEILGIDVWHDCNEGWLDLGPCLQGMKIQYQLYPGRVYDLDILIWPHIAKIWCGTQCGWVRTWQFLERRWLAFSISNLFPVRVVDMRNHVATVSPTFGLGALSANAKNDKNVEAFLPRLAFGEQRYFAPVIEQEETIQSSVQGIIWNAVEDFIPASYLDGTFDIPSRVKDIRHQDAVLYNVRESTLNRGIPLEVEESLIEIEQPKIRDRRESKVPKEKEKKKVVEAPKTKFEIKISGDAILSGAGKIISFETVGDRPSEMGEIIVLISTNNLPAQDDLPVVFVNVENVSDVPVDDLKKARISQIYTRWTLGDEEHECQAQNIKSKKNVILNDHHAIPLNISLATEVTATFLDNPFEIQLRGKRLPKLISCKPSFFGFEQVDRNFGAAVPKQNITEPQDVLLAVTKINARSLAKGINGLVKGEFPLFPPRVTESTLNRNGACTNDINAVRRSVNPDMVIQPAVILQAQMTIDVSIGLVGCKPKKLVNSFSRLYCFVYDSDSIKSILNQITVINDELLMIDDRDDILTGFALDTGDVVVFYVEGRRDGSILKVWELLEDYYNYVKSIFSSSDRYSTRIYPEMGTGTGVPFQVLKMFAPLGIILACPSVYARPALPSPTKSALLKMGRLVASKLRVAPSRADMPSYMELMSFRLELCVPQRTSELNVGECASLFTV